MFYVNDFWYTVYADTVFLNIYINRTRTLIFQTIYQLRDSTTNNKTYLNQVH